MVLKFGVPILAAAALGFGAATTVILKPEDQLIAAATPPATTTLGADTVAGLGELQTPDEQISISTAVAGVVGTVHVTTGMVVSTGQPLFKIDEPALDAELVLKQRALETATSRLAKLVAGTRPEDLPPAQARVQSAEVAIARAQDFLDRARAAGTMGALSQDELRSREFDLRQAQADLALARADLARLEAGTWPVDIEIAKREVAQAAGEVQLAQAQVERLTVRAPVDGTVLRVDVRPGEFVQGASQQAAPVVLGRLGPLQVRVQVDEEDASRVLPGAEAEGFVRGRERTKLSLQFVRIEPRIVPKLSLTGATTERVDTRVLFVVYEVVGTAERVYPGQKLDVFVAGRAGSGN
jgi:HlyD family secretion protein